MKRYDHINFKTDGRYLRDIAAASVANNGFIEVYVMDDYPWEQFVSRKHDGIKSTDYCVLFVLNDNDGSFLTFSTERYDPNEISEKIGKILGDGNKRKSITKSFSFLRRKK